MAKVEDLGAEKNSSFRSLIKHTSHGLIFDQETCAVHSVVELAMTKD
jgi:hypothetical protein